MRVALVAAVAFAGCMADAPAPGLLYARPAASVTQRGSLGEAPLGLAKDRDGRVYVPPQTRAAYPLMLLLHGAHGAGERIAHRLQPLADEFGFIIVAPDSRGITWDATRGSLGADVEFIDRALRDVFARYPVDPERIAVAGFSDGASYALSLGAINGGLFRHVIAFSPGFIVADKTYGTPQFFISHGTEDEILPMEATGQRLARELQRAGYRVTFRRFDGPHTIPPEVAREAVQWWLNGALRRAAAE